MLYIKAIMLLQRKFITVNTRSGVLYWLKFKFVVVKYVSYAHIGLFNNCASVGNENVANQLIRSVRLQSGLTIENISYSFKTSVIVIHVHLHNKDKQICFVLFVQFVF